MLLSATSFRGLMKAAMSDIVKGVDMRVDDLPVLLVEQLTQPDRDSPGERFDIPVQIRETVAWSFGFHRTVNRHLSGAGGGTSINLRLRPKTVIWRWRPA